MEPKGDHDFPQRSPNQFVERRSFADAKSVSEK